MNSTKVLLVGLALMVLVGFGLMVAPSTPLPLEQEESKHYDQPDKAAEYYLRKRIAPGQTELPVERYLHARDHIRQMPRFSSALDRSFQSQAELGKALDLENIGTWQSLGPGNIGGRTRSLLINPSNPNTIYAGGVAGGVWKTTNGGASWTPLTDLMANLAINSLAMDPHNTNTIYAGTGERYQNADGVRGLGIFKTTDAGANWSHLTNTTGFDFYYVYDVIVSPNHSSSVYAATATGIWYSGDSGATWTNQLDGAVSGICYDMVIRTDQAQDSMFAACRKGGDDGAIYRNTDASGSGTWQTVYTESKMARTSLALAPSNQNTIYALAASAESNAYGGGLLAVFRSTQSGDPGSWTARVRNTDPVKLNTFLLSNFYCSGGVLTRYGNQGWYDNVIAVDPVDANRVWAGGVWMFRSDDGGKNWGFAGYTTHVDQHAIVFHPQYNGTSNQKMFTGNDGGLYLASNARARVVTGDSAFCNGDAGDVTWTALNNNYGVTQFYHGLPYPDGKTYFGGTQDNGTIRGADNTGSNNWSEIHSGFDGGYVAIHPTNTNILYAEIQYGKMIKSTNGGSSWTAVNNGITDDPPFVAAIMMDHINPETLWFGGTRLWRTTNGAQLWVAASQPLPLDEYGDPDYISAIGISPTDSNYVLAGSLNGGQVLRTMQGSTTTGSTTWGISDPAGAGYGSVSSVVFHPTNKNIAYATYSTFGLPHVWKSTNAGASWTNLDGTGSTALPDIPVNSIVIDPTDTNRLYVGTDMGVFVSLDDGANWAVENTGFANVVTESLSIIQTSASYKLFAFTHGRGVFRVTIHGQDPPLTPTPTATATRTPTATPSLTPTVDPNCIAKPAKPALIKPKNNGKSKKTAVALDWEDATCATTYKVLVRRDTKTGTKAVNKTESVSQHTTKPLLKGKTYFWQIRACNLHGCTKSNWWSFTVK